MIILKFTAVVTEWPIKLTPLQLPINRNLLSCSSTNSITFHTKCKTLNDFQTVLVTRNYQVYVNSLSGLKFCTESLHFLNCRSTIKEQKTVEPGEEAKSWQEKDQVQGETTEQKSDENDRYVFHTVVGSQHCIRLDFVALTVSLPLLGWMSEVQVPTN